MTTRTLDSWTSTERVLARAFMLANVVFLLVTGYSLLTSPLWIPVTVLCWLGAAAMAGLAIWGPLPEA
jgi:hypothetical protein